MQKIAWKAVLGVTSLWVNCTASLTVAGVKQAIAAKTQVSASIQNLKFLIQKEEPAALATETQDSVGVIDRLSSPCFAKDGDSLDRERGDKETQGQGGQGGISLPNVGKNTPKSPQVPLSSLSRSDFDSPASPGISHSKDPIIAQSASTQSDPMEQVTSVSSLSDVQPTDWAYQALRSLVERYGVIAGYPDGTFRGNRAMTRYEFATALNATLIRFNELMNSGTADKARQEDLVTYERLQSEFATELAALRSRVDTLESRTETLEANQFSTTTKLSGLTSINLAGYTSGGEVKVERIDPDDPFSAAARDAQGKPIVTRVGKRPNITMSYATLLAFNTSFTGKDTLSTALAAGNGNGPANFFTSAGRYNTFGVPILDLTVAPDNQVIVFQALYQFPINDHLQVTVGPRLLWLSYFDTNAFTSAFGRGALSFNSFGTPLLNDLRRGAGAVARWKLSKQFALDVGYMADAVQASNPSQGLFEGTNAFTAQLTYSPSQNTNIRLLYDRANLTPVTGQISTRPIKGVADDGFGGSLNDATANSFGVNFDWLVTPGFGMFGRYTYSSTHLDPVNPEHSEGNVNAQAFQFGLAFPDLGKEGALGTLSFVVPFDVLAGRKFLVAGGGDGGTEYEFEASYFRPLTGNVAIVPSVYLIGNPNNFESNPTIYGGTLRMQFSF